LRSILKSNAGLTIIEVLVSVTIISSSLAAVVTLTEFVSSARRKLDLNSAVLAQRSAIIESLRGSDSLALATDDLGSACLRTRKNCSINNGAYTPLSLVAGNGSPLVRREIANWGFDAKAATCSSFPSERCPFRYEVSWQSSCLGAACAVPHLRSRGRLVVHDSVRQIINSNKYDFEISLGQMIGSAEQSCTALGGTYVLGSPPGCALPLTGSCPDDANGVPQVVTGYDSVARTKICGSPLFLTGSCLFGQVMIGIDAAGSAVCRPMATRCDPWDPTCNPIGTQTESPGYNPPTSDGGGDGGCGGGSPDGGSCADGSI
jgi:type II secretory pathway pseudopilin PulG